MAPAHKKRKVEVVRYKCTTCLTGRIATSFPDYNPTATCKEHLIHTCKQCLKQYIEVQVDGGELFQGGIKCPECSEVMRSSDIEMAATKKVFLKFVELERPWIADNTPGWRWCLSPHCRAGQIHETKLKVAPTNEKTAATAIADPMARWFSNERFHNMRSMTRFKPKQKTKEIDPPAVVAAVDICICNECGARERA